MKDPADGNYQVRSWLCPPLVTVRGSLQTADVSALVRELRQADKTIQFLRMADDSPRFSAPVAKTLAPPEDMVRLDHVLNVAATEGRCGAPTLRNCRYIVIYNVTQGVAPEFDLLDAPVLVTQEDWRKDQSVLASVR